MKDAKKFPNLRIINGWFHCDFVDPSGRRIQKSLKTKDEKIAIQRVMKMKTEAYEKGYFEMKRPVKMLFSELANKVLEYVKSERERSYRKFYMPIMKHLIEFFGKKYLSEITSILVTQYQSIRKGKVSDSTINQELKILKRSFNLAIKWSIAQTNPVKGVEFFKEPKGRVRFLTKEEINHLLDCCKGYLYEIVLIALHTGMRKGEIFNLRWGNIDLANRLIILDKTKNDEIRQIPMSNTVYSILFTKYREKVRDENEYVFANRNGSSYTDIRKSYNKVLTSVGIKNFRFHDLRHTFASQLVMSGVDILSVKKLMGHKKIQTTLVYSHLAPEYMKDTVTKLEKHLAEVNLCEKNVKNIILTEDSKIND